MCAGVHPKTTLLTRLPANAKSAGWYLIDDAYAVNTHKAYNRGVHHFHQWLMKKNIDAIDMKEPQVDRLICEYIHDLHKQQASVSLANLTIYGIQSIMNYPKGSLAWSKKAVRGWKSNIPQKSHAPISLQLAWLIAIRLAQTGEYRAGVAIMVAFNGLLRISEVTGLHKEHVMLPRTSEQPRVGYNDEKFIHLRLVKTKTGKNQSAVIDDIHIMLIFVQLITKTKYGERLFPFDNHKLRRLLQRTAQELGIGNTYVFHSLRHGGATHMWRTSNDIEIIKIRGRWKQVMTTRHYVQDWAARFLQVQTPEKVNNVAINLLDNPSSIFNKAEQQYLSKLEA